MRAYMHAPPPTPALHSQSQGKQDQDLSEGSKVTHITYIQRNMTHVREQYLVVSEQSLSPILYLPTSIWCQITNTAITVHPFPGHRAFPKTETCMATVSRQQE